MTSAEDEMELRGLEPADVVDLVGRARERSLRELVPDGYDWGRDQVDPFAALLEPWVRLAVERLGEPVALALTPTARVDLENHLRRTLCRTAGRSILRCFHDTGPAADDSQRAYRTRISQLLRRGEIDGGSAFLGEMLSRLALMWVAFVDAIATHYLADAARLKNCGLIEEGAGRIESVSRPMSDRHGGGRYVVVVTPESGAPVVYKPRSLELEAWFFDVVAHVNPSLKTPLAVPLVASGPSHGWMEYVAPQTVSYASESRRLGQRLGTLLYLTYVTAANDLHGENVVIAGDQPIAVDLECLYTPTVAPRGPATSETISASLLAVGLLPSSATDAVSPDRSVLGWGRGRSVSVMSSRWVKLGTGAIDCRPVMFGAKELLPPTVLSRDLLSGFDDARRAIDRLGLGVGPPADSQVRVVLRATDRYQRVLQRARNAGSLTDAQTFRSVLDGIAAAENQGLTSHPAVAAAEIAALERLDVPRFVTTVAGHALHDEAGQLVSQAFQASGQQVADDRAHWDAAQYASARAFIRTASA